MLLPHSATVRRLSLSGNGYDYADVATIACFIQPLDIDKAQLYSVVFTKSSMCYMLTTTDLEESDRLVYDGITYAVKGIVARKYGNLAHKQAILEEL